MLQHSTFTRASQTELVLAPRDRYQEVEAILTRRAGRLLRQRGFEQREEGHHKMRKWVGVRLRTNADKDSV
jgi:hypothetical protein